MTVVYHTTRRIQWSDTDAAGIAHFACFFKYMEEVEHEFLRSLGLSVSLTDTEGAISWPRVAASCEYQAAVRFEDVLDVELQIDRLGTKSVRYGLRFTHQGRAVAHGHLTAVCCRMHVDRPPESIEIPDWFAARLRGDDASA